MSTTITIPAKSLELISRLQRFPGREICQAMNLQNELTVGHIVDTYMHRKGPTTLAVDTARLWKSVRPSKAVSSGTTVQSAIGSNVSYAGVHEFGFRGKVKVKAFVRHNPQGDRTDAKWKFVKGTLKQVTKTKLVQSGISFVRAHDRRMNIPARAPIQNGIRDRIANYGAAIEAAIQAAWNGQQQAAPGATNGGVA